MPMFHSNSGKIMVVKRSPSVLTKAAFEELLDRVMREYIDMNPNVEPNNDSVAKLSCAKENSVSICSKLSYHLKNTSVIFISYAQTWLTLSHHTSRGIRALLTLSFNDTEVLQHDGYKFLRI